MVARNAAAPALTEQHKGRKIQREDEEDEPTAHKTQIGQGTGAERAQQSLGIVGRTLVQLPAGGVVEDQQIAEGLEVQVAVDAPCAALVSGVVAQAAGTVVALTRTDRQRIRRRMKSKKANCILPSDSLEQLLRDIRTGRLPELPAGWPTRSDRQ